MAEAAVVAAPEPAPVAPVAAVPAAPAVVIDTPAPAAPATPAEPAKGYWPDDWQKKIAGDDEKELKQLARYLTPADVWKKARSLEQRLSSGELKPTLPKDPKPEELKAWRKDNGIPEKPEDYSLNDMKIPKEDKEFIDGFLKDAHASNMTQDQAKAAINVYYQNQERAVQARQQKDEEQRVSALDTLNQEWGGTFRRNVNMIEGVLANFPEKVRDALKSARLPDGTALFNSPDALRGFAALALTMNPAGVIVPSSGGDLGKSMVDRYNEISKTMREDRGAYNKDSSLQKEYNDIIEGLIKHGLMSEHGVLKDRAA